MIGIEKFLRNIGCNSNQKKSRGWVDHDSEPFYAGFLDVQKLNEKEKINTVKNHREEDFRVFVKGKHG